MDKSIKENVDLLEHSLSAEDIAKLLNIQSDSTIFTIECSTNCVASFKAIINNLALLSGHAIVIKEEKIAKNPSMVKIPIKLTRKGTIIFDHFDEIEVKLEPRLFTLYLFLLHNTEGVDFSYPLSKEIEVSLFDVYKKVTGKTRNLEDLRGIINSTVEKPEIYSTCSKIKKKFKSVFEKNGLDTQLIDEYCIQTANYIRKIPIATETNLIDLSDVANFLSQHGGQC